MSDIDNRLCISSFVQGQASGMDWTLNLIFGKSETSRDIKKNSNTI